MQKTFNRKNKYRLNDLTINYLGYYTDNGAYYYYSTQSNMNYEQTIIYIKENLTMPIHSIQFDSWWYYKGLNNKLKIFPLLLHNRC
jgi:hypothetical protein